MLVPSLILSCILFGVVLSILLFRLRKAQQQLFANDKALAASHHRTEHLQKKITVVKQRLNRARLDPITGLPSALLFEDRLHQQVNESSRYQLTLGVLMIDIDSFSVINNALGYEFGNSLLADIAKRLQTCIRQVDSISRYHEDKFVVLLTQLTKAETAALVAQRMLEVLAEPFYMNENELYVTAGIGIAIFPSDGQDPVTLLHHAEEALRIAKSKGNHLYQFYQEKIHIDSERELALTSFLRRDNVFEEFFILYQPILDVQTETIFCMDASVNWQHPQLGLISNDELFQHAERQHKLNAITEWLLQQAGKQFLHWQSIGFDPGLLGLTLSIKQLEDAHFIYRLSQIFQEMNFNPKYLLLEIKETKTQISFDILEKAFNMLKYLGVKLAIDHFGTGAFSLSYLKNIQINYLKLDPFFIADLEHEAQSFALVKSIYLLTHQLSMELIIQGIESEKQVELLKTIGCHLLEGRLFSPPLAESEVVSRMSSSLP